MPPVQFGGQITHYIILSRKIISIIHGGGGIGSTWGHNFYVGM